MKRLPEIEYEHYRATIYEMLKGERLDVSYMNKNNDPLSEVNKQVVGEFRNSDTSAFYIFGGVGMFIGPDFAMPCLEGYDLRFNMKGMGLDRFEAVTDCVFHCISPIPRLDGDYSMYKIKTVTTSDPFTVSQADGIALCVISGTAEAPVQTGKCKAGDRVDLQSGITITPTGDEPLQYFIVYEA